jgi:hypothetical protein
VILFKLVEHLHHAPVVYFSMICMKINKGNSSRMCVGEIKVKDVDAGCTIQLLLNARASCSVSGHLTCQYRSDFIFADVQKSKTPRACSRLHRSYICIY